jgi:Tfp pilus assembly protein PilX
MKNIFNDKKSFSILLTLFIVSALLTPAVLVGDVLLRQARMNRGATDSETALYAAESGAERAAYQVIKNYCQIGSGSCAVNFTLSNNATSSVADSGSNITSDNATSPWNITLVAGQSFVLYLDLYGLSYPSGGQISITSLTTDALTDGAVLEHVIASGTETETLYTDFSSAVAIPISVGSSPYYLTSYYRITIHNRNTDTNSYDYSLTWTGNLPKVLKINIASGRFRSYQRDLQILFPRWQIFGSSS